MFQTGARIPTAAAERYAKQLCSHARRMGARAEWTSPSGVLELPDRRGSCHITSTSDALDLLAQADTIDQLAIIQASRTPTPPSVGVLLARRGRRATRRVR
jgi:hypothetical protein